MPAQHRTEPPPHNPAFSLSQVTVADGPALAANNIPAFWADPHWRLEWRHRALDYHTSQVALRYPRTLLRNLATARHQKAVDAVTGEIQEEILARKVYMKLEYLAVHPNHQRRGVATALVRSGMRQAEKLGLDIYVHAMKPGVPVYQRLGFRLERELIQDDSEYGGPGLFGDYFLIYDQPVKPSN